MNEKEETEEMREPGLLIIDHPLPYCTPKGSLLMFAHRTLTLASTSIIDYELTNANETKTEEDIIRWRCQRIAVQLAHIRNSSEQGLC